MLWMFGKNSKNVLLRLIEFVSLLCILQSIISNKVLRMCWIISLNYVHCQKNWILIVGRILTIVDYHTRCLWIILLKFKSEVSVHVQNFIIMIETQYHITSKVIRTDNGPEFLLPNFYASKEVSHVIFLAYLTDTLIVNSDNQIPITTINTDTPSISYHFTSH